MGHSLFLPLDLSDRLAFVGTAPRDKATLILLDKLGVRSPVRVDSSNTVWNHRNRITLEGKNPWRSTKREDIPTVTGHSIGILVLEIDCLYIPGDVGNAGTFSYPVLYKPVPGCTVDSVVLEPDSSGQGSGAADAAPPCR